MIVPDCMLFLQQGVVLLIKYLEVLHKCHLFENIELDELEEMLNHMSTIKRSYKKGQYIYQIGDQVTSIGILLSGKVHITKEDYWGNTTIIANIVEGMVFGESFACAENSAILVNAIAKNDSEVMFLDVEKMLVESYSSIVQPKMIRNLITVLANKNLFLTGKIEHIAKRTTREKLLSYLSEQSNKVGSATFDIPFNRQQLADYLTVDRSAMSNELSKLRQEGILEYHRSHFTLL